MQTYRLHNRVYNLKDGDCIIYDKKGLYEFSRSCRPLTIQQVNEFEKIEGVNKIESKYWIKWIYH